MKHLVKWALAAALVAGTATTALADGQRGSVKDGDRPFSWTGLYAGVSAGIATGQTTADLGLGGLFNTDYDMNGGLFGGQIGYNWQKGSLVLGVEGTYSGSTVQGDTTCIFILECKREVEWVATAVGRLGLAMDRSLVYVLGGVAWGEVNTKVNFAGFNLASDSQDHVGWVAGLGFEHAVSRQISLRLEYSHIDLGSEQHLGVADVDVKLDTVRLGVNYRFN